MTLTATPWINGSISQPQAELCLFCFAYAGGSAQIFRDWAPALLPTVEVCPVELPGRGGRWQEQPYNDLKTLVADLAPVILEVCDCRRQICDHRRPFAFFGHSLGGLISFELARHLRREYGHTPAHLLISGCKAPHLPDREPPIHALPDPEFLAKIRSFNGTPGAVLENAELIELLIPVLRADFTLLETYTYQTEPLLACPVTVLGGLGDSKVDCPALEAWRVQTSAEFSLQLFPGDHFFLHTAQADLLPALASRLRGDR